ncbi:MAG: hypothetical protein ACI4MH_04690 [Candidatus Coproplasma sp.]
MWGKKAQSKSDKAQEAKSAKPNKIKIQMAFDRCKDSIQQLLDQYQNNIDGYLSKMVALKKEGRVTEAERYKNKLKLVLSRQQKMNDLMDQVDQFSYMIDEAFAKNSVYESLGTVLTETNKINMSPEIKKILQQVNDFDDIFTKGLNKMDTIFGKVSRKISDIDAETSAVQDKEIDEIVARRLEQYDEQTTQQAQMDNSLFSLDDL